MVSCTMKGDYVFLLDHIFCRKEKIRLMKLLLSTYIYPKVRRPFTVMASIRLLSLFLLFLICTSLNGFDLRLCCQEKCIFIHFLASDKCKEGDIFQVSFTKL